MFRCLFFSHSVWHGDPPVPSPLASRQFLPLLLYLESFPICPAAFDCMAAEQAVIGRLWRINLKSYAHSGRPPCAMCAVIYPVHCGTAVPAKSSLSAGGKVQVRFCPRESFIAHSHYLDFFFFLPRSAGAILLMPRFPGPPYR